MTMTWRWLCRNLGKGALAAVVSLGVYTGTARAQEAMMPAPDKSAHFLIHSHVFQVPFKLDPKTASNVREMHLWMRDATGEWKRVASAAPTAQHFDCSVSQDGEYGFSMIAVDRNGVPNPANVTGKPPELMVLVETGARPGPAVPSAGPAAPVPGSRQAEPLKTEMPANAGELVLPPAHARNLAAFPPAHTSGPATPAGTEANMPSAALPMDTPGGSSSVLLVNNTHVSIEYNVSKVGPSGLAKVVIYATTDNGRSWKCIGEDTDLRSPAEVELPGEGTFGIRLVGVNGNGFGGKTPGPGDQPATTLEVDLTRPRILSWKAHPNHKGDLEIHWKATDKNLSAQPINLFYRTNKTGPWQPLALKVKNDGCYRWSAPRDLGSQFFIRLQVVDMAGNVAQCESSTPIVLDRTVPDISVTGISVMQSSTAAPGDNAEPSSEFKRD
jgi:hypothetical protein